MKIRQLAVSLNTYFDDFISKMENHEAVTQLAIEDMQKAAAKIRMEKKRVQHRIAEAKRQQEMNGKHIEQWRSRAKASALDEEKALACLRQCREIEKNVASGEQQLKSLAGVATSLDRNLLKVEQKLNELQSKKALLSSRELQANTQAFTQKKLDVAGVDSLLDRWELNILEKEYAAGGVIDDDFPSPDVADDLAQQFEMDEEERALKDQLAELLREENQAVTDTKHIFDGKQEGEQ